MVDDQHRRDRYRGGDGAGNYGNGKNGNMEVDDTLFGVRYEHDGNALLALGYKAIPPVLEHRLLGAQMV